MYIIVLLAYGKFSSKHIVCQHVSHSLLNEVVRKDITKRQKDRQTKASISISNNQFHQNDDKALNK